MIHNTIAWVIAEVVVLAPRVGLSRSLWQRVARGGWS